MENASSLIIDHHIRAATKARRRCFAYLLLDQTALAVTIGMAARPSCCSPDSDTRLVWVVLLASRVWDRSVPPSQNDSIDLHARTAAGSRCILADALSTATYFDSHDAAAMQQSANANGRKPSDRANRRRARGCPIRPAAIRICGGSRRDDRVRIVCAALCVTGSSLAAVAGEDRVRYVFFENRTRQGYDERPNDPKQPQIDPGAPEVHNR